MSKKKKLIAIIAGAVLLVGAAVSAALFATGNLFGTPVNDGEGTGGSPACTLTIENGASIPYLTLSDALIATKGKNIEKNVTIKLLRDCEVSEAVEFPFHSTSAKLTFDLNGFKLSRNLTGYVENGEVIKIADAGDIVITDSVGGGCISGGKNLGNGGGISISNDRYNTYISFDGITLKDNASSAYGGGIYCPLNDSTFYKFKDVNICNNTAALGGGVFVERTMNDDNAVRLFGTVRIADNTNGGLLLGHSDGDARMLDVEQMAGTSEVVIERLLHNEEPFILDTTGEKINEILSCFKTGNSSYSVEKTENALRLGFVVKSATVLHDGKKYSYDSIPQAWSDVNNPSKFGKGDVELVLNDNWLGDGNKNLDTCVTVDVHGFGSGRLWPEARPDGSTLTLNLNGYTIDRYMGAEDRNYGNILSIEHDLKIVVKNGTLTGGHNDYDGGGVYINAANAYVTFDGITIRNCKSDDDGGGVYCSGNANHVTFKDCTIKYNECNGHGGGIFLYLNDKTHREILFTGKVQVTDNNEQVWELFKYIHRPDDVFLDVDKITCTATISFPSVTEGSCINLNSEMPTFLIEDVEDTAKNRKTLSYFHYTPQSEKAEGLAVIIVEHPNNTITLAIKKPD